MPVRYISVINMFEDEMEERLELYLVRRYQERLLNQLRKPYPYEQIGNYNFFFGREPTSPDEVDYPLRKAFVEAIGLLKRKELVIKEWFGHDVEHIKYFVVWAAENPPTYPPSRISTSDIPDLHTLTDELIGLQIRLNFVMPREPHEFELSVFRECLNRQGYAQNHYHLRSPPRPVTFLLTGYNIPRMPPEELNPNIPKLPHEQLIPNIPSRELPVQKRKRKRPVSPSPFAPKDSTSDPVSTELSGPKRKRKRVARPSPSPVPEEPTAPPIPSELSVPKRKRRKLASPSSSSHKRPVRSLPSGSSTSSVPISNTRTGMTRSMADLREAGLNLPAEAED